MSREAQALVDQRDVEGLIQFLKSKVVFNNMPFDRLEQLVESPNADELLKWGSLTGITRAELQDLKVNVVQRAANDEFSRQIDQSNLPYLVDAMISMAERNLGAVASTK